LYFPGIFMNKLFTGSKGLIEVLEEG